MSAPVIDPLAKAIRLGQRLLNNHEFDKARQCYLIAQASFPRDDRPHLGLAKTYAGARNIPQMELSIKRAILLRPDLARVYSGAASPLRMVDRVDDSVYWFRRAKLVEPNSRDVRTSLGLVLIQSNNWQEGWAEYEHREGNFEFCTEITHRGGAIWKGESLAGKSLLLTAEQGFGDTFQFIRFVRQLAGLGAEVTVVCPHDARLLLENTPGISHVVSDSGETAKNYDYACLTMSLPHLLGITPETCGFDTPYLKPATAPFHLLKTNQPRVGITWRGNPNNPRNDWRSCSAKAISRLFQTPGVEFFAFQPGFDNIPRRPTTEDVFSLEPLLGDFSDTAALVDQMDLVITVDTSIAHLAGALGKPVWLLLNMNSDWRWMLTDKNTPWYHTMTVFRAKIEEDWLDLMDRVITNLDAFKADFETH